MGGRAASLKLNNITAEKPELAAQAESLMKTIRTLAGRLAAGDEAVREEG